MGKALGQLARRLGRFIPAGALRHVGGPAALFFHGVEHQTLDGRVQLNHHDAAMFARIAGTLRRDFDVRPLSDIDRVLADPTAHRRAVFLMADDGYANTLTVAADLLEDLPWTLFVSAAHIGTGLPSPVFLARLFYLYAPAGLYHLPHLAPLRLGDAAQRQAAAGPGIDALRALPAEQAEEAVAAMRAAFADDALDRLLARFTSEHFLDWDGVRALKARGVEIGAHADTHWPMHEKQSDAWLVQQTTSARARIEAETGPCRFFAYPFGNTSDIGPKAWRAVEAAGFSHAFTTLSGSLAANGNRFLLPRYGIGPCDIHLASLVPLLGAGNRRLRAFQQRLAG
jgi:peptidoglycan/xylan/chitin deacetylase (PgdA/CDA1 family)